MTHDHQHTPEPRSNNDLLKDGDGEPATPAENSPADNNTAPALPSQPPAVVKVTAPDPEMDRERTCHLLEQLGARELGEGDLTTGGNLLALVCAFIAGLERPGTGLFSPAGEMRPIGFNVLIAGAATTALFQRRLLDDLNRRQGALRDHAADLEAAAKRQEEALAGDHPGATKDETAYHLIGVEPQPHIGSYCSPMPPLFPPDYAELTEPTERHLQREIRNRPNVVIADSNPGRIHKLLPASHLGKPLVVCSVRNLSHARELEEVFHDVTDGASLGPGGTTVRGMLVGTISPGTHAEAAASGDENLSWMAGTLWLVDGSDADDTRKPGAMPKPLDRIHHRVQKAMRDAWGRRLNFGPDQPKPLKRDLGGAHERWAKFLRDAEPHCPGITRAAGGLLTTLVYGILRLLPTYELPSGFKFQLADVEAFARTLVRRMIEVRATLAGDGQRLRRHRLALCLAGKLVDHGPATWRELSRRIHRITRQETLEALEHLEANGVARRDGKIWIVEVHQSRIQHLLPQPTTIDV